MKRQRKRMSRSEAIFILVIGLLLGTVFTFGEQFWHAPVDRRELRSVDAVYQRYRYVQSGGHNSHSSMTLYFENEEPYEEPGEENYEEQQPEGTEYAEDEYYDAEGYPNGS